MIHGISDTMHYRIQKILYDRLVKLSILTFNDKIDFLVKITLKIADDTRKTAENLIDRNHPDFHDSFLQLPGNAAKILCVGTEFIRDSLKLRLIAVKHGTHISIFLHDLSPHFIDRTSVLYLVKILRNLIKQPVKLLLESTFRGLELDSPVHHLKRKLIERGLYYDRLRHEIQKIIYTP